MDIDLMGIAEYAMLLIPDEKKETVLKDITGLLDRFGDLPDLHSDAPLIDPEEVMGLRDDVVIPSLPRDVLLAGSPSTRAGCILIPRVLD
ncbi:MAG: Asp-tRNA(Asn)/Glu-tRNA(Gln) amidotransferase GatCAB subunit C [Oscillospiraceae bacterium]|nr:Asp-tRNA(Asn)/Glu-tRNA(Gln) amidotransferase GatCAB subunit C [Oscillospiraceae bacterium]